MAIYNFLFYFISIALLLSYFNYRFVGLHPTIAMMSSSLIISLVIIIINHFGLKSFEHTIQKNLHGIDFNFLLMKCILSFLLFAGALSIKLDTLKNQKWEIGILSIYFLRDVHD